MTGDRIMGSIIVTRLSIPTFLALMAAVMLFQVLARPAVPVDETRYLAVAWEMHLSGDAFHLTRNFESYSHKPPLLFWLINGLWLVTGVSDIAARLVGPAFALLAMAGTGLLAWQLWPQVEGIALRAVIALAGFTVFVAYGGATMFDALLTVVVLAGMGLIWRIGQWGASSRHWLLLGGVIGAGVLAKGPVIVVHLLPILLLIRWWAPEPPAWRDLARGVGIAILLALGIAALWLVPALMTGNAANWQDLLWAQTADRISGTLGHGRPFWFLWALLPVILFPWGWSWRLWRAVPGVVRGDAAGLFCAIWALSGMVLFTLIGGKQIHYLLPELPAVALLVARVLPLVGADRRDGSLAPMLPMVLSVIAVLFAVGVVPVGNGGADLAPAGAVILFAAVCLVLAAAAFRLPLMAGHLVLGVGLSLAAHMLVLTSRLYVAYDTAPIAARLAEAAPRGIAVVNLGYNAEFNFAGRLTVPVATPSASELAGWAMAHPKGLIVGQVASLPLPPAETIRFYGHDFGLWPVTEALISQVSGRAD